MKSIQRVIQALPRETGPAPFTAQSANVESPPPLAYGNYAAQYDIQGTFTNSTTQPQPLDIRLGSPDEMGHVSWHSLFDQSGSFLGANSTRFTGTVRITLSPSGEATRNLEVSVVHGRVQSPQSLLSEALMVKPDQRIKLQIEIHIPTNSTPPLLLQFQAGHRPSSET
ncbi:MAG: DUF3370 family protein [Candidatus Sericytochromatia bacterium]